MNGSINGLKRPRQSSEGSVRSTEFNECMRYYSKQATELKTQFTNTYQHGGSGGEPSAGSVPGTAGAPCTPEAFELALWSLLAQLRPFLFLCFPLKQSTKESNGGAAVPSASSLPAGATPAGLVAAGLRSVRDGGLIDIRAHFGTNDAARDMRHVLIAHRVYSIVVRLTKYCPAASLHGCLTLLSLLPKLADPSPAVEDHTRRYLNTLECLLSFLRAWSKDVFYTLLVALTAVAGFGEFLAPGVLSTTTTVFSAGSGEGCPFRKIRVLPDKAPLARLCELLLRQSQDGIDEGSTQRGNDETVKRLFRSTVAPHTTTEALVTAYGLWSLLGCCCRDPHTTLVPAGVDLNFLVHQACAAITTTVVLDNVADGATMSSLQESADQRRQRLDPSNGAASVSSPLSPRGSTNIAPPLTAAEWTERLHCVVGPCLASLVDHQLLLADTHGPQILSTVVSCLCRRTDCQDMHGAIGSSNTWLLQLLQWLCMCVASSTTVEGKQASWLTAAVFGDASSSVLLERLMHCTCHFLVRATPSTVTDVAASSTTTGSPEEEEKKPFRSESTLLLEIGYALLSLIEAAVVSHPSPGLAANKMLLADNSGDLSRHWLAPLLCARLPSSTWLARSIPLLSASREVSTSLSTPSATEVLILSQKALLLLPSAVTLVLMQGLHSRATHLCSNLSPPSPFSPSLVRLLEVNLYACFVAQRDRNSNGGRAFAAHFSESSGSLVASSTRWLRSWSFATLLDASLRAMDEAGVSDSDFSLLLESFVGLFRSFFFLCEDEKAGGATVVIEESQRDDPYTRANAAVTVLRRVEAFCAEHKSVHVSVPAGLWALFYSTATRCRTVGGAGTDESVEQASWLAVLKRGALVPKKTATDMVAFAARLGGLVHGVRGRLTTHVFGLLQANSEELRRLAVVRSADDAQQQQQQQGTLSPQLQCAFNALVCLLEEVSLLGCSFHAVVQYIAQERDQETTFRVLTATQSVNYLLFQAALLQRLLFGSIGVARLLSRFSTNPAAAGQADSLKNRAHMHTRAEETVVDVDVDVDEGEDDDGDEEAVDVGDAVTPRRRRQKKDNGGQKTDISNSNEQSEEGNSIGVFPTGVQLLIGKLVQQHGQLLSTISILLSKLSGETSTDGARRSDTYAFGSILRRVACASLALSPRSRDVDHAFYTDILVDADPVLHAGWASVALMQVLVHRSQFSFLEHGRQLTAGCGRNIREENASSFFEWTHGTDAASSSAALWKLLATLTAVATAFRRNADDFLQGADCTSSEERTLLSVCRASHALVALCKDEAAAQMRCLAQEGQKLLGACVQLWECAGLPTAARTAVTELAMAIMDRVNWSPEDLCRHNASVAMTNFFIDLCLQYTIDIKTVLRRSADVVAAPFLVKQLENEDEKTAGGSSEKEYVTQRLGLVVQEMTSATRPNEVARAFAPTMAYVLYASTTAAVKEARIKALLARLDLNVAAIHSIAQEMLPSIVLHLISLEGDAQLVCYAHPRKSRSGAAVSQPLPPLVSPTKRGGPANASKNANIREAEQESEQQLGDDVCFSVFAQALHQLVALTNCQPNEADVARALSASAPSSAVASNTSSEALVKSLFDVLDSIDTFITPSTGAQKEQATSFSLPVVSLTTARRWLLGLASFLRFLGPEATLIAAKLPTMLEACSAEPALMEVVCHVWLTLLRNCRDHFLCEHAPAIVIELVSLDFFHDNMDEDSLRLLLRSLRCLYDKTRSQTFWQSYFAIMCTSSRLIRSLSTEVDGEAVLRQSTDAGAVGGSRRGRRQSPSLMRRQTHASSDSLQMLQSNKEDPAVALERQKKVAAIMDGFLSIMESSSAKCKAVFVRALFHFLETADVALRLEMGRAAAANLEVVPALLRCARELSDGDDIQYALRCVGVIGAVAPIPVDTLPTNDTEARMQAPQHLSETSARQNYYLTVPLVMNWRSLPQQLLAEFCPRALANTADPRMHDHAAYAVQELLRIYTQKERRENSGISLRDNELVHVDELERYVWWSSLEKNTQEILSGFTTTHYATLVRQSAEKRSPEYRPGTTFEHWLFAFFQGLALRCVGSFADMAKALRNVAKRDHQLLLFLLHLIIVQFLDTGDDAITTYVLPEFKAIFAAAAEAVPGNSHSGNTVDSSHDTVDRKSTQGNSSQHVRMSLRSDSAMEMRPGNEARDASSPRSLDEHVQCLLHLLEDIRQLRWELVRIETMPLRRGDAAGEAESANARRLSGCYQEFLDQLPWHVCAQAAIDVGSHVRALRCLESQLALPKAADAIQGVPLQRIFAALNDRDSAKSIHNMSRGLKPEDVAFSLENTGEWQLAQKQCELFLQHCPQSVPHKFTYLRCMRQLGQFHMMSRYAEQMLDEAKQLFSATTAAASVRRGGEGGGGVSNAAAGTEWSVHILQNYANEAAWRLGEWRRVHADPSLPVSLAVPVATFMTSFRLDSADSMAPLVGLRQSTWQQHHPQDKQSGALQAVRAAAAQERAKLTSLIRSACREGYSQAYPYAAMLHALGDVELVAEMYYNDSATGGGGGGHNSGSASFSTMTVTPSRTPGGGGGGAFSKARKEVLSAIVGTLAARLELVENTLEAREPLLSLHRSIYRALGLTKEVSDTWIGNAQLLKDGNFPDAALSAAQQSNFYVSAENSNTDYYTLTTELLQGMDRPAQAIEFAQTYVSDASLPHTVRAQLQIRLTNMMKDIGSQTPSEVVGAYLKATELDPASETAHHSLALFYDQLYTMNAQQLDMKQRTTSQTDNVAQQQIMMELVSIIETWAFKAAEHFGLALLRGAETVSISLPRLLTLWLDSTETLQEMQQSKFISPDRRSLFNFNNLVEHFILKQDDTQRIPPRVVMTQLTLLLSRLGHKSPEVVSVLTRIVVLLMTTFPQQTLWNVLSVTHSKVLHRRNIAERYIVQPFRQTGRHAEATWDFADTLFRALIGFCYSKHEEFSKLNRSLTEMPFMKPILQKLKTATFLVPTVNNLTPNIFASSNTDVFVNTPTLAGFGDRVRVLSSMQKPKRILVNTNEGQVVSYLAKSKDEPRKDIRTMEVAFLMNTIFLKNPDARRKHFSLLRYCIAPLNDDCAIIEWVSNISTLRDIASECYRLAGKGVSLEQIKRWDNDRASNKITRRELMQQRILPVMPPVLHQWFDRSFRMNQEWYQARTLYTQSTALWSMVGHIVGLGDRHCENLSLGVHTGEMMHVDFAALFDYGETLAVPERVRCRLTQNMVDAMGVLGANGPFRANCEIALRCQQDNRKAVMSIVETLVHDPLLEWTNTNSHGSRVTPQQRMERVSRRLDGYLDLYDQPRDTLALNVEGQVAKLISHSSAPENLDEMYTWWMPWV